MWLFGDWRQSSYNRGPKEARLSWRYLAAAMEAALKAGAIQRERYGQAIAIERKGEIDLVTEVDLAAEAVIVDTLHRRFPAHDIVTEETPPVSSGSRHVWYVDPLDGTTNYAHSYPFFATSIALVEGDEVVVGVILDPLRDELYSAERGAGAFLNGQRLQVTRSQALIESLLITGFPYDIQRDTARRLRALSNFMPLARGIRRDGSAALDLCYVASGRADGFWEERLHPWDVLAGKLIVEEAGGRVSRFDGSPIGTTADEVVASNGALHERMLDVLRHEV
jgi:myo-inositol-1(or 4)-monophosphatase